MLFSCTSGFLSGFEAFFHLLFLYSNGIVTFGLIFRQAIIYEKEAVGNGNHSQSALYREKRQRQKVR